jgi:nitrile hydratase subunit beta
MRAHDLGGQNGFGPVDTADDEAPFHADWEARVWALNRALGERDLYTDDEFRDAIESMPREEYLRASYYERWLHAMTTLLERKGLLERQGLLEGEGLVE